MATVTKLKGKIEEIIEQIINGDTFRTIAAKYKVSIGELHKFLSSEEHSARANAALKLSASSFADKAEQVLIEAAKNQIEMQRARELAQHYRWKAAKRSPKEYSEKQSVDVTSNEETIRTFVIGSPEQKAD